MPFIVVYDANVLYPNTLRDLLIRIAQQPHLVQAKWTNEILDEMLGALRKNLPDITEYLITLDKQIFGDPAAGVWWRWLAAG